MTKTELELKIDALRLSIKQSDDLTNNYASELSKLEKQLKDINKPKLKPLQFDELTELIEEGIEEFDFDDTDNYSLDFHIDYDNRIAVESLTFDNVSEVARVVCDKVYKMFAIKDEEDTNEENQD
mgnify:CR=1 FL=1